MGDIAAKAMDGKYETMDRVIQQLTTENDQGCSLDTFQNNLYAKRLPIAHDLNQKCLMHDATRSEDVADTEEEIVLKPLSGLQDKATASSPVENDKSLGELTDDGHSPLTDREEKPTHTHTQTPPTHIPSNPPNQPLTQLHTEIQSPTEILLISPPGIPIHVKPTPLAPYSYSARQVWERGYTSGLFSSTHMGTYTTKTTLSQNVEPITTGRHVVWKQLNADILAERREHILNVEQPPSAMWSQHEIVSV